MHLHSQSGGRPCYRESQACFVPGTSVQDERSAGACAGSFSLAACLQEGADAGVSAAAQSGWPGGYVDIPVAVERDEAPLQPLWEVPAGALAGDRVHRATGSDYGRLEAVEAAVLVVVAWTFRRTVGYR